MVKLASHSQFQWSLAEQVYPFIFGPEGETCYAKQVVGTLPSADNQTFVYYNTSIDKVLSVDAFHYFPGDTYDRRSNPIPWVRRQYDVYNISIEIYTDPVANKEYVAIGVGPSQTLIAGHPFSVNLVYTKV